MRRAVALFFLASSHVITATDYYVRTDGDNGNAGTTNSAGGAWLTVDYAADNVAAGDTVRIQSGTYDETVSVGVTGTAGNYINYVGEGPTQPIIRKFTINAKSYLRLINLEMSHDDTTTDYLIQVTGACSFLEFHDLYLHHWEIDAFRLMDGAGSLDDFLMRGCTGYYASQVPDDSGSVYSGDVAVYDFLRTNRASDVRWLIEYNTITRCGDYLNLYGDYQVARNNYMGDCSTSYWTGGGEFPHPDIHQTGENSAQSDHFYEANFYFDNRTSDAHCWQAYANSAQDNRFTMRGNVIHNFGSYVGLFNGTDDTWFYNNTADGFLHDTTATSTVVYGSGIGDSNNWHNFNNIFSNSEYPAHATLVGWTDNTGTTLGNNISYNAPSGQSGQISTADPLYSSIPGNQFWVGASSAALNAGKSITTVASATGSGTSFDVAANQGPAFCDGGSSWHAYVEGDTITVNSQTVQITAISGDTITVDESISWTLGDDVYWGSDTTPDIGAYPYDGGNTYTLTATLTTGSPNTVAVNDSDICRMVVFYEDGIPQAPDFEAPYQYTDGGGTVTAKAYHRYASTTPVVNATDSEAAVYRAKTPSGVRRGVLTQ